jgi:hypothetical protein
MDYGYLKTLNIQFKNLLIIILGYDVLCAGAQLPVLQNNLLSPSVGFVPVYQTTWYQILLE